ncbi:MAG TPA: SCP2 sterol-binding domain-containing protein [Moraxellaceae bacterium]|nr:SCP2 sterol-binding domain-containing protein [Moraxellaceae bacterium]
MTSLPEVLAIRALEKVIRQALALDPGTRARLGAYAGKRIFVETRAPALGILVSLESDGVYLSPESGQHPHATIEAPSFELLKMALSQEAHFIGGPVKVNGDVMLVQELHAIGRQLDIDWESGLARLLGDTVSYPVSRGLRHLFGFANRVANTLLQNTGEYLREEKELVPVPWEVEELLTDNRDLRVDLDRIESRLTRLKRRLDKLEQNGKDPA